MFRELSCFRSKIFIFYIFNLFIIGRTIVMTFFLNLMKSVLTKSIGHPDYERFRIYMHMHYVVVESECKVVDVHR